MHAAALHTAYGYALHPQDTLFAYPTLREQFHSHLTSQLAVAVAFAAELESNILLFSSCASQEEEQSTGAFR